jgi:glutathione S-transferase
MSLTFYYAPMSTASVTSLVLAELDIPHERVRVDITNGGTKTPEFLQLNPNGKVPVIVHDGTVIFESCAITMYLGETFGVAKKVYPEPGPRRGEAMKWIAWANVTFGEAIGRWARNTKEWVPAEQRNQRVGELARKDIDGGLRILDAALEGRSFLAGDYTLADAHLRSFFDWASYLSIDLSSYQHLQAWAGRCAERPGYQKLMAEMRA